MNFPSTAWSIVFLVVGVVLLVWFLKQFGII